MTKTTNAAKLRTTRAASATPKKTRYISINLDDELAALEKLGMRERWVYLCCKQLANFKTGTVGTFGNQKLSYVDIAAMVKAPATHGRGDGAIDDTQARDFLLRMQAVGLVKDIGRRPNGGLRFDLPLSPITRKPSSQAAETGGKMLDIFPDAATLRYLANPALAWAAGQFGDDPSVVINTKRNINTDGAASIDAAAPRRANGAALSGEFSADSAAANTPLTADDIREAVGGNWNFAGAHEPQALQLYESWAVAGITLDELHAAMTSVEEDADCPDPRPADLHDRIWPVVVDRSIGRLTA